MAPRTLAQFPVFVRIYVNVSYGVSTTHVDTAWVGTCGCVCPFVSTILSSFPPDSWGSRKDTVHPYRVEETTHDNYVRHRLYYMQLTQ